MKILSVLPASLLALLTDHEIHLFAPAVVIQAIQDVSAASRDASRLPARP